MAKFFLTNKAVEDLSEIWNYSFKIWSESQADKYYGLLIETCRKIAKSPEIGQKYKEIGNDILGFRVGKHIIFYHKTKPKEIVILRILHERMDLKYRMKE